MNEITLDHIRQAAEWSETAINPCQIAGLTRSYDQSRWDCGTACCIWGAASIIAGNGPATDGPPEDWSGKDLRKQLTVALLRSSATKPRQILDVLSRSDFRGADLSGADFSGADLSGADFSGADLYGADLRRSDFRGANLSGADLRGANLSGADFSGADLRGAIGVKP
jgi:hypothetical protein